MEKIIEKLRSSQSVAIMAHVSEDPDALGSCFAMAEVMRQLGKEAVCYLSDNVEAGLEFIGGDYVIYSDGIQHNHDLCICLDCGDRERLGERANIFRKIQNSVNIDHHYTNNSFADVNYIEGNSSATGEILYKLFRKMDIEITAEIARFLYIAIAADTGCFKYSNVSPETLRIVADLLEHNINHADITRLLFDTESLPVMKLKGTVMGNIHTYYEGKVNIVVIDEKMFERYGVEDGGGDLVNIPRRVVGTEIAVCIKKHKDKIKISMRSNGKVNVSEIVEIFGGGGHAMAAGATTVGALKDVEKKIVDACKNAIEKIK